MILFYSYVSSQKQLKDVQLFGYHSDQLYKRAVAYLEDVKDLLRVCEKAADFILHPSHGPPATDPKFEIAEFQTSRTLRSQQKLKVQVPEQEHILEFQIKRHPGVWTSKGGAGKTITHIHHHSIDLKK